MKVAEREGTEPVHTEPVDAEAVDRQRERGKMQLVAVAVSLVGSVVLVGALGGSSSSAFLVQLAVTGLLLFQVFRARSWARWVLVGLTALAAIGNAAQAFGTLDAAGNVGLLSVGLALIYAWCVAILAFSRPVKAYFVEAGKSQSQGQA